MLPKGFRLQGLGFRGAMLSKFRVWGLGLELRRAGLEFTLHGFRAYRCRL